MHDCVPLGTGNSRSLKSSISAGTTWEQALAMLRAGTFPIDLGKINEEGVAQKGDPLNQETLLKTAVAALYGKDGAAVPSDIFEILSKAALYETGVIKDVLGGNVFKPGNCDIYTTTYAGTGNVSIGKDVSVTFPKIPELIITWGSSDQKQTIFTVPNALWSALFSGSNIYTSSDIEVSGNAVTWKYIRALNNSGNIYNVVAFIKGG